MSDKAFNLVDEPWIPCNLGKCSLKDIFIDDRVSELKGTPIQKIAVFKLLQAVAQDAVRLETEADWMQLDLSEFSSKCCRYLQEHHEEFWLYGDRPFLQVPDVVQAEVKPFAALSPEKASGNSTVLTLMQTESGAETEADKALLLVTVMSFAFGGKKVDSKWRGDKRGAGRAGPGLGARGYLHSFIELESVRATIRLNFFTEESVKKMSGYASGIGVAPWRKMPSTEKDEVAAQLLESLMGRLIPLSRFCLLEREGMHYTEGLVYPRHQEGGIDPTQTVSINGKKSEAVWACPQKMPWRSLTALMSFLSSKNGQAGFFCRQMILAQSRLRDLKAQGPVTVWSGGLSVSDQFGDQYMSGQDDYVESKFTFDIAWLGDSWFDLYQGEMKALDQLAKALKSAAEGFTESLKEREKAKREKAKRENAKAERTVGDFWIRAGAFAQDMIDACGEADAHKMKKVRQSMAGCAKQSFMDHCPAKTPRQLVAWQTANNRLENGLKEYLK